MGDHLIQESLEDIYDFAPCGFVFTRPGGEITRVNQTFLDLTGYQRHELISGRRFQDLLTVPGKIFYENQYAPLLRMQGFVKEIALDLVRIGHDPLPVLVNARQRVDAEGTPVAIAISVFDASDRRAYERELLQARRNAEQLSSIVMLSSDAILRVTPEGIIQTWNEGASRLFGYQADEIVGRSLSVVLDRDKGDEPWQRFLARLHAGEAVQFETVGRRSDGATVDISVGLTPHPNAIGHLAGISAIMRDIGHRRELERLQQEFLAMATHELRNPLTGIKANAQLLRRRQHYSERAVDVIIAQADRLGHLIDDLLLASQIEADRLDLRPERIDVVAETRAAVDLLGPGVASVRLDAPPEPIWVLGDRHRLNQVLANLLANAVKYSPEGAGIAVRIAGDGQTARIAVVDQGIGIPPEEIPHLFDRFYRVKRMDHWTPGAGLGLYISRRIVEAHGGRIEVASRIGAGSTFTVVLPIGEENANASGRSATPLSDLAAGEPGSKRPPLA